MMKRKSRYSKVATMLLSTTLLFACSNNLGSVTNSKTHTEKDSSSAEKVSALISKKVKYDKDDNYSDWEKENPIYIELNGKDVSFDKQAPVIYQDGIVTIKTGGTYVVKGKLDDGQIVVDAEDKNTVRLILNGVNINSTDCSAIQIIKAEKTTISLEEGSENYLSDGKQYHSSDDEPNAAVFSKDDLTINGTGKLIVAGNFNDGIVSKDKLKIMGGKIKITSVDDGLIGRDLIAVNKGNITIEAGGDGIKSTNDEDASKGNIVLEGGTINIVAENDGIQAETSLLVGDGSYKITTGGGSPETISNSREKMRGPWEEQLTTTNNEGSESESAKGIKATSDLVIGGGMFKIDSSDDAVHSDDKVTIAGGSLTIATGDDGIHADTSIVTTGGKVNITKSNEGLEGNFITVNDGEFQIISSDDGINIAGGNDGSSFGKQQPESNGQSIAEENKLTINGGYIFVDAAGDGLDSNGSIFMTDGTVIVNGPTENMNGSLDYNQSFEMSGGFLIAAGSSGMAQATSEQSTQNSLLMTFPEVVDSGTLVHLENGEGNTIVTFAPKKEFQSVFISSPKLVKDATYTLFSGGTSTGNETDGLYSAGNYQGGTKVVHFTISNSVTWLNESGVTTAKNSGPRGGFNGNGDQNQPPGGMFENVDEETRNKIQSIMEQERQGTITREEAQTRLDELGVKLPGKGHSQ